MMVGNDGGQRRWATKVGNEGGQRQWATMVGNDGGQRRWAMKSLKRVKHERATGNQEDDEEPRTH